MDFSNIGKTLSKGLGNLANIAKQNSTVILTGCGIGGFVLCAVTTGINTKKAIDAVDSAKRDKAFYNPDEEFTTKDAVKTAAPFYIMPFLIAAGSSACLISSAKISCKREAAALALYKVTQESFDTYKAAAKEIVGKAKEEKIQNESDKKTLELHELSKDVPIEGIGATLCYDKMSGRYFMSDMDAIKKAEIRLNKRMIDDMYVSLNELYMELDISPNGLGSTVGWNLNTGMIDIYFSSQIAPNDEPCLVLSYNVDPKYENIH